MELTFKLDPILEKDSIFIKNLDFCQMRLINNSDFPWVILVPRKNGLIEITDLSEEEYSRMNNEIRKVSLLFKSFTNADKLNIATIGNVVSQLHIHIIARRKNDKLFPKPVWGCEFIEYAQQELNNIINDLDKLIDL